MDRSELISLADALEEACSREGKPSGIHMVDGQRMLAQHFRRTRPDDDDAQSIADVAECMAHCIENEALLFECLKTEAEKAAELIRTIAASNWFDTINQYQGAA